MAVPAVYHPSAGSLTDSVDVFTDGYIEISRGTVKGKQGSQLRWADTGKTFLWRPVLKGWLVSVIEAISDLQREYNAM